MMRYTVSEEEARTRLDVFLAAKLPQLSRSFIKKLCKDQKVLVNKQKLKASQKVHPEDKVSVDFDLKSLELIPDIDLPIVYEDKDCLVINKPAGLLTHSKGAFNPEATVATFMKSYWKGSDSSDRLGIVHRLDRATSGVIICAKTEKSLTYLQKQFSSRNAKKSYYAIVVSGLEPTEAIIDMPIARNPRAPKTFHASSLGKPAQTHYKIIKEVGNYSLVELKPVTGRTHQLRVHLAHLKHPIVGDQFYKGEPADRLYLHAESLQLQLPNGLQKTFSVPLPSEFEEWLSHHAE